MLPVVMAVSEILSSPQRLPLASQQPPLLHHAIPKGAQAWVRMRIGNPTDGRRKPTTSQRAKPRVWLCAEAQEPCVNHHGKAQKGVPICKDKWLTPLPTANRVRLVGRRTIVFGRTVPTMTWVEI